jgi:hypothetical protein
MTAASNYLENKILDHSLNVAAFTQPSALYLGLFTNTSTNAASNLEAGTLTDEVGTSGTAYQRQSIAFGAASGGSSANSATVTFPVATASWGTITHVAILDAQTSGNVLYWGAVTTAKPIDIDDTFQVSTNNITISLN